MKIAVLNASPKGELSVTMQYVGYLQKHNPDHRFSTVHVAQQIKGLERSAARFDAIMQQVREADLVLWAFPVYFFLVPSQLVRFIELVHQRDVGDAFAGKYTAAVSSSKLVHDHAAHDYLRGVCEDLGMRYVDFYSAEMEDLTVASKRDNLLHFGTKLFEHVEQRRPVVRRYDPAVASGRVLEPQPLGSQPPASSPPRDGEHDILLVTDSSCGDHNLEVMIDMFLARLPAQVTVVDIAEIDVKGGCLGCMRCCPDGQCAYRDGYEALSERMLAANAIVHAVSIGQRYFSARYKMMLDRHFRHGHRVAATGKQVAYIVSGPLRQVVGLEQNVRALCEIGRTTLCGIVSDEQDSAETAALLGELGRQLMQNLELGYEAPWTFLGKGGHLLFRDLVFEAAGALREDYTFYKANGLFDYPQKNYRKRLGQAVLRVATGTAKGKDKGRKMAKHHMVAPLRRIVEQA